MRAGVRENSLEELALRARCWLLKKVIFPLGDRAFGQTTMKRLSFLEKAQWWDRDRLYAERDRLLQSLIQTVYHEVPYYHDLMESSRLKPEDIRSPSDLYKLPVATKASLSAEYPDRITRVTGHKVWEQRTSGSTGSNFVVQTDKETVGWYRASLMLAMEWSGWRMGEPALQTGMNQAPTLDRRLKNFLMQCYYVPAFALDNETLDRHLALMEKHRIRHLWGYPGSLYCIATRARERGWNRPLKGIVTWGDTLFSHYREAMETAFGARVTDTYGCAEGTHISAQCPYTYHVHSLDVIVEYLDDDGAPVPSDKHGNIIFTRLHAGPMPIIRYRVGDLGIAGPGQKCECGRGYDTMDSIQGRDTDLVTTPSGNRLIVHVFTGILGKFPEIGEFQVVQEDPAGFQLKIVPHDGFSTETAERIVSRLTAAGASDMEIQIDLVDEIPMGPTGKRRFVINRLAPSRTA